MSTTKSIITGIDQSILTISTHEKIADLLNGMNGEFKNGYKMAQEAFEMGPEDKLIKKIATTIHKIDELKSALDDLIQVEYRGTVHEEHAKTIYRYL